MPVGLATTLFPAYDWNVVRADAVGESEPTWPLWDGDVLHARPRDAVTKHLYRKRYWRTLATPRRGEPNALPGLRGILYAVDDKGRGLLRQRDRIVEISIDWFIDDIEEKPERTARRKVTVIDDL